VPTPGPAGSAHAREGRSLTGQAAPALGVGGILAAAALWALVGLITKRLYAISSISPLAVGALRLLLATPALLALSALLERPTWRIARRDWWLFILYGLAMAAYQLCFLAALTSTTVTAATLLLTTAPVFVTLLAALFLGERPTAGRVALLGVAVVGAGMVVLGTGGAGSGFMVFKLEPAALRGDLLALGAALAYACYYLFSSVLGSRYSGVWVMGVAIGVGACVLLPAAVVGGGLLAAAPTLGGEGWLLILLVAFGSTALAYAIYGWAMRRTPATLASVAALIEPAIAAGLAWRFLGERLAPIGLLGGALLLGGIAGTYALRAREEYGIHVERPRKPE
jgi:DME family drug/metabolite transporter